MRKIAIFLVLLICSGLSYGQNVIYSYDFANGIPTGWANFGTPSAALWEYRGPNTTPNDTVGSRGAYASGDPIESTTRSNGFMIFDSDYLDNNGSSATMGQGAAPSPHIGVLATSPLNFSSYTNVSISLESFARTFYGQQWLIFSTDGGVNFTDSIQLHSGLAVNATSSNPELYILDISSIVGGQSNVMVVFLFDGTPGNAIGNGYYFWMFDDVKFIEIPNNDLAIVDWDIDQGTKRGVYGTVIKDFVEPVSYSILAQNKGKFDQPNTRMRVTTSSVQGGVQVDSTLVGTLVSGTDTIINSFNGYLPADTGFYSSSVYLLSDSNDYDISNNTVSYSYSVSESFYALDHGNISSYLGTNSFSGCEDGFQMLNIYETDSNFSVNSVYARISSLTRPGAVVYIVAYDSSGVTGGGGQFVNQANPNYKSSQYTVTVADSINGYLLIPVSFVINGGMYVGLEMYSNSGQYTCRVAIDETITQDPYASLIYILNSGLYTNPEACFIRLNYNPSANTITYSNQNQTICSNDSLLIGNNYQNTPGVYPDSTYLLSNDSIILVNLQVNPTYLNQYYDTTCSNVTFTTVGGKVVTQTGVYLDTLASVHGCDSVIETNLQVNPTYFTQVFDTICDNGTFTTAGGQIVTTSGIYLDTLQSNLSCDSVIETNLQVNPTYFTQVFDTICDNGTFTTTGGQVVTTTGVYLDTLQSHLSCDSVIETNLQVNPIYFTLINDTICSGDSLLLPDSTFAKTKGVYQSNFSSRSGCDSTITVQLIVLPSYRAKENATICDGEKYILPNGNIVSKSGIYYSNFNSSLGCDSIIETSLIVLNISNYTLDLDTCEGIYSINGKYFEFSGVYQDTTINYLGCDSIITYNLKISPLDTTVNVDLSNTQPKLIASEIDAYFQWLLCDSLFYPIPNETSNTFYPTSNGKYSVEISRGICIDTSACYSIQSLGLKQSGLAKNEIRIFPNPSNGNFIIALVNTDFYQYTLEIRAISGGLIHRNNYQGKTNQIELNGELPSGSYLVSIISSKAIETKLIFIR